MSLNLMVGPFKFTETCAKVSQNCRVRGMVGFGKGNSLRSIFMFVILRVFGSV